MKYECYLATIQYIPDINRNERLNVGVVLHCPDFDFLETNFISRKNRLKTFDDELDMEFYKLYIEGIKDDFSLSLTNNIDLKDKNLVKKLSYNYVNQFQFQINTVYLKSDISGEFEKLKKLQLHYDYDKKKRLTPREKFDIVSKRFSKIGIDVDDVKPREIAGFFEENINFDFKLSNTYVKIFEFNKKNYKHLVNQIKTWMFNSKYYSDKIKMLFFIEDNVNNIITRKFIDTLKSTNNKVFLGFDDPKMFDYISSLQVSDLNELTNSLNK